MEEEIIKERSNYSFEEFKLIFESAEKVTERRIANNKFNYSICTAIFLAISLIWKWSSEHGAYEFAGLCIVIIMSIIALIFASYWIQQIREFKALNNAKFQVINKMEENLHYPSEVSGIKLKSIKPFAEEWRILKDMSALQKKEKNNIIALKSSNAEYFIPKTFRFLFVTICCISVIIIIMNFGEFINSIKCLIILE